MKKVSPEEIKGLMDEAYSFHVASDLAFFDDDPKTQNYDELNTPRSPPLTSPRCWSLRIFRISSAVSAPTSTHGERGVHAQASARFATRCHKLEAASQREWICPVNMSRNTRPRRSAKSSTRFCPSETLSA